MFLEEDRQENPGTLALAVSWVIVFVAILLVQWSNPVPAAPGFWFEPLSVSTLTSHRFGDMTWREVRNGEPWRLLTATFIHFGLIHLALNGLALLNLGRLVEPWYRTGPFLAICLAIGGLGNLTGGTLRHLVDLARPWVVERTAPWHLPHKIEQFIQGGGGGPVSIHTGGGSTILLGLLTLGAVVGWRSRTRVGAHLQKQMLFLLALTAALGVVMYQLVDNYGHLGGAIVGAVIGLFDGPLQRFSASRWFRRLCWAAVAGVSIACVGVAIREDRVEVALARQFREVTIRLTLDDALRADLDQLKFLYVKLVEQSPEIHNESHELDAFAVAHLLNLRQALKLPIRLPPEQVARDRADLEALLEKLDKIPREAGGEAVAADLATLRELGRAALDRSIHYSDVYNFVVAWKPAYQAVTRDLAERNAIRMEIERQARESF